MKKAKAAILSVLATYFAAGAAAQIVPGNAQLNQLQATQQMASTLRWQFEGNANFGNLGHGQIDLALRQDRPYVVFVDAAHGNKISVMTRAANGPAWVNVGPPGFSQAAGQSPKIAIADGEMFVAFEETVANVGRKASVMRYNQAANSWDYVGQPAFSLANARHLDIEVFKGRPYVSYNGYRSYSPPRSPGAVVQAFNRATGQWDMRGSYGFGYAGTVRFTDLEIRNDNAYLSVFLDGQGGTPNRVYIYRYNRANNSWTTMGPAFNTSAGLSMMPDLEIAGEDFYLSMVNIHKYNHQQNTWQKLSQDWSAFDMELRNQKVEGITRTTMPPYSVRVRQMGSAANNSLADHNPIGQHNIAHRARWIDLEVDKNSGTRFIAISDAPGNSMTVMRLKPLSHTLTPTSPVLSTPAQGPRRVESRRRN
ncbi:MAG: hypothetical protein OIF38_02220 [Cellvibrionaceae bacterium]|nr:hypothetical protein [Cellvibrionaceae bacterium]